MSSEVEIEIKRVAGRWLEGNEAEITEGFCNQRRGTEELWFTKVAEWYFATFRYNPRFCLGAFHSNSFSRNEICSDCNA